MTDSVGGPAPTYVVTLRLSRAPSDAETHRVAAAARSAGAVRVERGSRTDTLRFTRQTDTLSAAIAAALLDLAAAPELAPLWVEPHP